MDLNTGGEGLQDNLFTRIMKEVKPYKFGGFIANVFIGKILIILLFLSHGFIRIHDVKRYGTMECSLG